MHSVISIYNNYLFAVVLLSMFLRLYDFSGWFFIVSRLQKNLRIS